MRLAAPAARPARRIASGLLATVLVAPGLLALVAGDAAAQAGGQVKATATNRFEPPTVTVPVGGTVTWTNEGGFHTVTGGSGGTQDPASPMNGQLAAAGATYSVKFDKAGRYPYFCQPHVSVGMVGEVVVGAAAGGGTPASSPTASPDATPSPSGSATRPPQQPGASESPSPGSVPGIDDNPVLREIEEEEAAKKKQIGGFNTLLMGISAATLALCVAVFASTRPRRSGR